MYQEIIPPSIFESSMCMNPSHYLQAPWYFDCSNNPAAQLSWNHDQQGPVVAAGFSRMSRGVFLCEKIKDCKLSLLLMFFFLSWCCWGPCPCPWPCPCWFHPCKFPLSLYDSISMFPTLLNGHCKEWSAFRQRFENFRKLFSTQAMVEWPKLCQLYSIMSFAYLISDWGSIFCVISSLLVFRNDWTCGDMHKLTMTGRGASLSWWFERPWNNGCESIVFWHATSCYCINTVNLMMLSQDIYILCVTRYAVSLSYYCI